MTMPIHLPVCKRKMSLLREKEAIRSRLLEDRCWAAYALGDLAPDFFAQSEWFANDGALILVLRAFAYPVVFTMGTPDFVRLLLDEIGALPHIFFLARPENLPTLEERYRLEKSEEMWRMALEPAAFEFAPSAEVERLGTEDLDALEMLFADGAEVGQSPDFFAPSMLEKGVYFGVWEGEALVAAAGTHLFEPSEGVGAIGNVYTRRDRRGRGLATQVTGAVAAELVRQHLPTIVLNVNTTNFPALRVYERLGFRRYCRYFEGIAVHK